MAEFDAVGVTNNETLGVRADFVLVAVAVADTVIDTVGVGVCAPEVDVDSDINPASVVAVDVVGGCERIEEAELGLFTVRVDDTDTTTRTLRGGQTKTPTLLTMQTATMASIPLGFR